MRILFLFLLIISSKLFAADCVAVKPLEYECEFKIRKDSSDIFFLNYKESSRIHDIYVNDRPVLEKGQTYYHKISGNYFVAKNSFPIPQIFLIDGDVQKVRIGWLKAPEDPNEVQMTGDNRFIFVKYKFLVASFFTLVFTLILFVLKKEFNTANNNVFRVALITGVNLTWHLYLNSLHPHVEFKEWTDAIVKFHILASSTTTVLIIALTDYVFNVTKKRWYLWIPVVTFLIILVIPGWKSTNHYHNIIFAVIPSMWITTLYCIFFLFKFLKDYDYKNNVSLMPILIAGGFSVMIAVVDTYAVSFSGFVDSPASGYGLLLYFITVMLSYIIQNKQLKISSLLIDEKVADISRQVAHDIKSPLTALKVAVDTFSDIKSENRHFIKRSVERIDDIINDIQLSSQRKLNLESGGPVMAYTLLESVLSEKRFNFKDKKNIELINETDKSDRFTIINVDRSDLQRMISNLINNSAEALDGAGIIKFKIEDENNRFCRFVIEDNGKGIPEEYLEKVKEKNFTMGKASGQGLGLSFVNEQVKSWGGEVTIESSPNGTKISFPLPKGKPPVWYKKEINFSHFEQVVLVDDDYNIHRVWENRIKEISDIKITSFYSPDEFLKAIENNEFNHTLFIFDFEFIGFEKTGFDLVDSVSSGQMILSTSRFEEKEIQKRCLDRGLKLLAKDLIQSVYLHQQKESFVLIDDDSIIHSSWKLEARRFKELDFHSFKSVEEFLEKSNEFDPLNTKIYIDRELGDGIHGEVEAKKLSERGFHLIYLATGHDELDLSPYPYIVELRDKLPPF